MNKIVSILKKSWLESGLGEGDLVLLHSDVRGTIRDFLKKKIKITPLDIFNSFLETVGPSGTILFPNFDINLSNKMTFDLQNSNSKMGILTQPGVFKCYGTLLWNSPIHQRQIWSWI